MSQNDGWIMDNAYIPFRTAALFVCPVLPCLSIKINNIYIQLNMNSFIHSFTLITTNIKTYFLVYLKCQYISQSNIGLL